MPRTTDEALMYFALSSFYDSSCNNQLLRMQGQEPTEALLRTMTGVEYEVRPGGLGGSGGETGGGGQQQQQQGQPQDGVFVIIKRVRQSPDVAPIVAVYYIVLGTSFNI